MAEFQKQNCYGKNDLLIFSIETEFNLIMLITCAKVTENEKEVKHEAKEMQMGDVEFGKNCKTSC